METLKTGPDARAALHMVIQNACPSLSDAERSAAEANLLRYLETAIRIAEHAEEGPVHLTAPEPIPSIKERSKGKLKT